MAWWSHERAVVGFLFRQVGEIYRPSSSCFVGVTHATSSGPDGYPTAPSLSGKPPKACVVVRWQLVARHCWRKRAAACRPEPYLRNRRVTIGSGKKTRGKALMVRREANWDDCILGIFSQRDPHRILECSRLVGSAGMGILRCRILYTFRIHSVVYPRFHLGATEEEKGKNAPPEDTSCEQ
jgi:hypothetical protein